MYTVYENKVYCRSCICMVITYLFHYTLGTIYGIFLCIYISMFILYGNNVDEEKVISYL